METEIPLVTQQDKAKDKDMANSYVEAADWLYEPPLLLASFEQIVRLKKFPPLTAPFTKGLETHR